MNGAGSGGEQPGIGTPRRGAKSRRQPTFAELLAARAERARQPAPARQAAPGPAPAEVQRERRVHIVEGDEAAHVAVLNELERCGVLPGGHSGTQPLAVASTVEEAGATAGDERLRRKLDHAEVVVAGGRGLGDAEGFAMVEALAAQLGGAPAASGGAVASGWAPASWLVGQTGLIVCPLVYLAFGISGASQHLVGLAGAGTIVAVNEDPDSPIFGVADLAVVAHPRWVLSRVLSVLG